MDGFAVTVASIIQIVARVLNYGGSIVEITVVVFLIAQQCQKNAPCRSAYYAMFAAGSLIDAGTNVSWVLQDYWSNDIVAVKIITNLIMWYGGIFNGFWTFLLAVNRCTSMTLPTYHQKLWHGYFFILIFLAMFILPIVIHAYSFYDLHCRLFMFDSECSSYLIFTQLIMSAVNCVFAAVSFIAVIASTIFSPFMAKGNARSNLKQRLLTHAGFSSILLVIACALQLSAVFSPFRSVTFMIIRGTADIIFAIFHYSSIVVFFMVSDAFRNSYVYFYGRCFKFVKPRQFKTSALISVAPDNRKNLTAITLFSNWCTLGVWPGPDLGGNRVFKMRYSNPDDDKSDQEKELEEKLQQIREQNERDAAELELYEYASMSCNGDYSSEEPTTTETESEDDKSDN